MKAFTEGAEDAGNEIKELYLQGMKIGGCLGCETCQRNGGSCIQKDDMDLVYEAFSWCDIVVFASPQYWGTVTGQLKVVIDRLFAVLFGTPVQKRFVIIMTARGNMYEMTEDFFSIFTHYLGWDNLGNVLGAGKEAQAKTLGASIS